MSTITLVLREMLHRRLNFALGVLAVAAAAACLAGAMTRLEAHRLRSEEILAQRQAETAERLKQMKGDVRKITLQLQFNITILAKEQNRKDFLINHYAEASMPEEYAAKLGQSDLTAINHLEPSLTQKITWTEQNCPMILTGVRGEVPLRLVDAKKPFHQPVPKGSVALGQELARQAGVSPGGAVKILGREFKVAAVHDPRGNVDDVTAWVHLQEAQELLKKPGQINAMKAMNCECSLADLDKIPGKIEAILPGVQAILDKPPADVRTAALARAEEESQAALAAEQAHRERIGQELEASAALVVPLVGAASAVWLAFLAFSNVRARREEIGILRALGVRGAKVLALFMLRAAVLGVLGGALGYALGFAAGWWWSGAAESGVAFAAQRLFSAGCLALVLAGGPLLAALASWLPALAAAQRDPAELLRADA
ncbi:MAG: FtsX-like permease family protein [Planctomycetes bacterium]|nr:FtsX-like permease family protein [Planctomycetota bacterium]